MNFINVSQRVGYTITKTILQGPDDVTEVVKLLAGNDYLPSASEENSEDDAQTLRLQMKTKDKRYMVVIMADRINVVRSKTSEEDNLGALQEHADKSFGILKKLQERYNFEIDDVAIESDYYDTATDEAAAKYYKKFANGDEIPSAWRFNRLFIRTMPELEDNKVMEHQTFMRDEVQMRFENDVHDRLLLELTCAGKLPGEKKDEVLSKYTGLFITQLLDTYRKLDE